MSYANRELIKSIVDFLSKETNEGTQVAVQMLRDTYQIPSEGANTINLEQVWRSGCQQLNIVDNSSDEKFKAFMKQLDSMGYFKNTTPTDTYEMRYEKAKHKFQEKMKVHQQQQASPTVDVEKAEKAKEEGNDKLKNKDFEGAVECYKEAMKFNPENHIYPSNMAAAYISLNQYEKALKCAEQSIKLNDKYVKAYQRLAQAQAKLNKKKEAIATYEKLIELNPEAEVEYRAKIDQLSTPAATSNPFAGLGGMGGGNPLGGLGGMGGLGGLGDMLNNPQFMQMAMNMMQQPGMQEMMGNMMRNMGGPGGLANMFGGMDGQSGMPNFDEQQKVVMNQILEDPEVQQSDKLTRIFTAAREDPQSLAQHMSDPEVSAFMQKYATKMFGGNNPLSSMFGGGPRDDNDKHDDSNMYA